MANLTITERRPFPSGASRSAQSSFYRTALYRAVWRWHFYAGLLVLPFLILLAVTGGIYLFHDELNAFIYRDWNSVEARQAPMLPASALLEKAESEMPGEVTGVTLPASATSAAILVSATAAGEKFTGYANLYDGQVLGITTYNGLLEIVRNLHSLEQFGFLANCLIEIAAGWTLILIGTGVFLWWPRRRAGGVVTLRGSPGRRVFWRDLHAVTGIFAALVVGFLAITGMPWSAVWGKQLHSLVADAGLGRPVVPSSTVPTMTHAEHMGETNWTLDPMPVPASQPHGTQPIGLDRAVAIFDGLGLPEGYQIALPKGANGVYTASYNPERVEGTRVVHIDQYTGEVLADLRFSDFGVGSQAIGWSIAVHQGDEFGLVNQLIMLAACIATVLMSGAAVVMWWKRRPKGSLGVPPAPQDRRAARGMLAVIVAMGVLFPLVGLSVLAALGVDWVVGRHLTLA